jgi:hypothetical protein
VDKPVLGGLVLFNMPGHVVLVSQIRNGQIAQFMGSQTSTGPKPVNLPDHYWQPRPDADGNVRYFQICLPGP